MTMSVGDRIYKLMEIRGLSQIEFCRRTGIPQSTMSSWKGKKQNPSLDKLKVICDVLQVDPFYLISGAESNESLNSDYLMVYRNEEEYQLLIEYRKLDRDFQQRLMGYLQALRELNK